MRIRNTEEFGKAIQSQRKKLGYTQGYLAEVTGLSASFISNLENGKETAELGKALVLLGILGLNLEIEERK